MLRARGLPLALCVCIVAVTVYGQTVLPSTEVAEEQTSDGITNELQSSTTTATAETAHVAGPTRIRTQNVSLVEDTLTATATEELLTRVSEEPTAEATHEIFEPPKVRSERPSEDITNELQNSTTTVTAETAHVAGLTRLRTRNVSLVEDTLTATATEELLTRVSEEPTAEATHEMFEPPKVRSERPSPASDVVTTTVYATTGTEESYTDVTTDYAMHFAEECPRDSLLPCVTKCCPFGQTLANDRKCRPSRARFIPQFTILVNGFNDTNPINETEKMDKYNLIVQNICPNNRYRLEPDPVDSLDEFHLLFNGSLWLPNTKPVHTVIPSNQYCMEVFIIGDEERMLPLVCFVDTNVIVTSSFHFIVYPIGLLVSVPFLLATFLVYNLIPELRDLHGKTLSCYVFCLMVAYILLATVQLGSESFDDNVCVGVAFAIQFSFLACFFWLNVLCFDTWRNVFFHGGLTHQLSRDKQRSYFMFYSIYAWTCTIVLIVVTMVMNFEPTIPSSYLKPSIGVKTCWFNTQMEAVPYFYGPVAALLIINVILFITTAVKLICEHHKKPSANRTPTQTVHLCLSLFFIMGINWLLELISWAAGGPPFIWYITDICNTLQGIFIFIVFVMDRRVRSLCQEKLFPRLRSWMPCCSKDRPSRGAVDHPRVEYNGTAVTIPGNETKYMFPNENQEIEHERYRVG